VTDRRLWYYPNPAHKRATTEAGPPRWYPAKEACPEDMTLEEREELVRASIPLSDDPYDPKRFAVQRKKGRLIWYRTLLTREHPDGRIEIHGHPFTPGRPRVPPAAARKMREVGAITEAEYRQAIRGIRS